MRFLVLFMVMAAAGPAGDAPRRGGGANPDSPASVFRSYKFPGHPNVTHLCQERVYTREGHALTWDAFASPVSPSKLVAYYRRKLGGAGFRREGAGGRWSLPAGADSPERILEVSRVGADNPARECEKRPPADTRAIILLSRREGR